MFKLHALSLATALIVFVLLFSAGPAPSALAQSTSAYTGEYYDNVNLIGTPVFTRLDPAIDFEWGAGSPDARLPADNFSIRWTRWYNVESAGAFLFTLTGESGSRLLIDGNLIADLWYDHARLSRTARLDLTPGYHLLRVESYNRSGPAGITFTITPASAFPDWKGEYFSNQELQGQPALVRNDAAINFDWGMSAPDPDLPVDHFSVRWTRDQVFEAGTYRFTTRTDDGVRVWVGGRLVIDHWQPQSAATHTADVTLAAGLVPLRVEYFDETDSALAVFSFAPVVTENIWTGEYFNNLDLSGNPALIRNDPDLHFAWGTAGPGQGVSASLFSARWDGTRTVPASGFYTLYATADDGVRVSFDGKLIVDEWHDSAPATYAVTLYLNAGSHKWHVEYYQHLGGATLSVQIVPGVDPAPPASAAEITIENNSLGWLASGNPASWKASPNGRGGKAIWSMNNAFTQPLSSWARWYPSLPEERDYAVLAFIPANVATTHNARYTITHAGRVETRSIAQALYAGAWASLGTFHFEATGGEYVALSDVTYECYLCYTVVWDAVKFVPQ